jgi:hypothetical protein
MAPDAEARRSARKQWRTQVFGPGEEEAMSDADALFWDEIPLDERAEVTWQLSAELFTLSNPRQHGEPRLPRSAFVPVRR